MSHLVCKLSVIYLWFIVSFGGLSGFPRTGMSGTVGTVGSCDRRGLDLVAVGTGVGASAIFCADVPIRPDTKIGNFWSCDLGSQWGAKNGGFFGERPRGRGENNYFTKGQRPKVK